MRYYRTPDGSVLREDQLGPTGRKTFTPVAVYIEERDRLFREAGLDVWAYGRNGAGS